MLLVNLSQDKSRLSQYLSNTLLKDIDRSLKEKKKVILYLNKRWEYSSLICNNCNHLYKCQNCDASMNVHKYPAQLICHICNAVKKIPIKCEKCGKSTRKIISGGTGVIFANGSGTRNNTWKQRHGHKKGSEATTPSESAQMKANQVLHEEKFAEAKKSDPYAEHR